MSSDCIHMYFAGFIEKFPTGCTTKIQTPVIGKFNTITNTLVWEKTYFAMDNNTTNQSRGTFWSIFEYNGELVATGQQGKKECDNDDTQVMYTMILKANANTGIAMSGYPKFVDVGTSIKLNNIFPFTENGIVTGTYGIGTNSDNKAIICLFNSDGSVNTNFGNNGFFVGPEKVIPKRMIKINEISGIKYAYIGNEKTDAYKIDVHVEALNESGTSQWSHTFSETSLINDIAYVDIMDGDKPLCDEIPETGDDGYENNQSEEGWDLKQLGNEIYLSCKFDWVLVDFPGTCNGDVIQNAIGHKYTYCDMALVKVKAIDGTNMTAKNVGVSDAPDFFPELEIIEGKVALLGARASIIVEGGVKKLITDGKLSTYNTDLSLAEERFFNTSGWDINCSFDMAFNCEGELFVSGNNDINDEDYYFYKFSSGCQKSIQLTNNDITTKYTVSGVENWATPRKVNATVIVPNGATLNIGSNNASIVIEFGASWELVDYDIIAQNGTEGKEPRIVVEPGGILNLNNCVLTGLNCPNVAMWDGVQVKNGGEININNSSIKNAKYGVLAGSAYYGANGSIIHSFNGGGGKVISNGGAIENCRIGMFFGLTNSSASVLTGTNFICTDFLPDPSYKEYIPNAQPPFSKTQGLGTSHFIYSHITSGIRIDGGSINNTASIPPEMRGIGIYVYATKMDVNAVNFTNLHQGIYANSSGGTKFLNVTGNTFNANKFGILFRGGSLHNVLDNSFSCAYSTIPGGTANLSGIGIYNAASTKTLFEENEFTFGASGSNTGSFGIISENTGSASNLHRKNEFTNIHRGDQTQSLNVGLNLWCNEYTNTNKAWAINITTAGNGAFRDQGECLNNRRLFPDNKFHDLCTGTMQNPLLIHSHSNLTFTYWKNTETNFPQTYCNQFTIVKDILTDCNSTGALESGCEATTPINLGNADDYYALVPTLPDGTERQLLVNDLIRYYLGVDDIVKIKTLLNNETDINYKMLYAEILLNENNITSAQNVVNNMPSSSPEKADYASLFGVVVYAVQNNLKLNELPEDKIETLEDLAEGRSIGAYRSQTILTEYYNKLFPLIVETESGLEYREKKLVEFKNLSEIISITPNPSQGEIEINLLDRLSGITEIQVYSMEGKLMYSNSLDGLSNIQKINLSNLEEGVFIVSVTDVNNRKIFKKFIKN